MSEEIVEVKKEETKVVTDKKKFFKPHNKNKKKVCIFCEDKNCKSIDKFELMFDPSYKGERNFTMRYNESNCIIIDVDGYSFVPDLSFMNNHAVCKYCGQIYTWDYE